MGEDRPYDYRRVYASILVATFMEWIIYLFEACLYYVKTYLVTLHCVIRVQIIVFHKKPTVCTRESIYFEDVML